jgi:outer membrane receptor for ferrienterochelin and colicins
LLRIILIRKISMRHTPSASSTLSALAAVTLALGPASPSHAAPSASASASASAGELQRLEKVVISASLRQQLERDAPATVTVLTRQDLLSRPEADVASILKSVSGVAMVGAGANDLDLTLRGMPGDYTLLLVDGRKVSTRETMNRGSGGVQSHFLPPLSAIERIEVVRGPMSSLYGPEAMGGVVNIITRKRAASWAGALRAGVEESRHDEIGPRQALSAWAGGPVADGRVQLQLWASGLSKG